MGRSSTFVQTVAIARRELAAPFERRTFYVAALLFSLALHAVFFLLGVPFGQRPWPGFWAAGIASLDVAFAWLPVLGLALVPAIAMASWAGEWQAGTDELLLTWPVADSALVLGKFAAALAVVGLVVALAMAPLVIVAASLGPVDWGGLSAGLLGTGLLLVAYTALSLAASAATKDPLVAFLLAALVLSSLHAAGAAAHIAPGALGETLFELGPQAHFGETAARGVLAVRDVLWVACLAAPALYANLLLVQARRQR